MFDNPSQRCHFSPARKGLFLIATVFILVQFAIGQAQTFGKWTTLPYTMPINPVHATLLKTGKVLIVAGSGNFPPNTNFQAALWNPQTGNISVKNNLSWDMFCNGTVVLPDGRPFIFGGTLQYDPFHGESRTAVYNLSTGTFSNAQSMAHGRWYPTGVVLGDGRVMVFSGSNEAGSTNKAVELYTVGSGWSTQYGAFWTPPLYPRMHLLPNGNVFYSGPSTNSALFNPSTHAWTTNVATTKYGNSRTYGTSVLLPLTPQNNYVPRVMILGGGNPATNSTEIIDLSSSTPTWNTSASMSQARIEMNAVILPSGKVLALGGSVNDEDSSTKSLKADLFDPVSKTFSSAGTNTYARLYHSVALLLRDATVWLAGGNPTRGTYESHMEIYHPAYLFTTNSSGQTVAASRPSITSAPTQIGYGESFQVQTPDPSSISSVALIRDGSVTHAFDMDQRMVGLSFSVTSGALTVGGPPNGNIAPPGYYMLFVINNKGVPSVARFVKIASASPPSNGINFVQVKSNTLVSASSISATYTNAQTAGNLNILVVGWNDASSNISSIRDSAGNTYTAATPVLRTGAGTSAPLSQIIYYARNIAAGPNTVTVNFNQTAAYVDIRILEYKGASTLDASSGAVGNSSAAGSGSATTTAANELIFGANTVFTVTSGAGSGFTSRIITPFGDIAEDQVVTSTGSYSASAPLQSAGNWVMQMVTFK